MSSLVNRIADRYRLLLLAAVVLALPAVGAWAIYGGNRKILVGLGVFTFVFLFQRAAFTDLYLVALTCYLIAESRFGPMISDDYETYKWKSLALLALASIVVLAASIRNPAWPRACHLAVVGVMALAMLSITWSINPTYTSLKALAFGSVLFVAFGGVWTHVTSVDRAREIASCNADWMWLVFPPSLAAAAVSGAAFVGTRLTGVFVNPNALGFWGTMGLPLLVGLAAVAQGGLRRTSTYLLAAAAGVCLLLSASRGGVIAGFVGLLVYLGLRWPRRVILGAVIVALAVGFIWAYEVQIPHLAEAYENLARPDSLEDLSLRRYSWEAARSVAMERPWFGHGFGLGDALFEYYDMHLDLGALTPSVHNTYLDVLMNSGFAGLAMVVVLQLGALVSGFVTWYRDRNGTMGLLALAFACSTLACSIHALVETVLLNPGSPWCLPYWTQVAILYRLPALQQAPAVVPEVAPGPGGPQPGFVLDTFRRPSI